jgi:hypothetical protein
VACATGGPESAPSSAPCPTCAACALDAEHDATLLRWPDWPQLSRLVASPIATSPLVGVPLVLVLPQAAVSSVVHVELEAPTVPAQRRPVVTIASLPTQRVSVTDGPLIAA